MKLFSCLLRLGWRSFRRAFASIWRMRSRVVCAPTRLAALGGRPQTRQRAPLPAPSQRQLAPWRRRALRARGRRVAPPLAAIPLVGGAAGIELVMGQGVIEAVRQREQRKRVSGVVWTANGLSRLRRVQFEPG